MYQVNTTSPLALVPDDTAIDPRNTADDLRCMEHQQEQAREALRARGPAIQSKLRRDAIAVLKFVMIAALFALVMHARADVEDDPNAHAQDGLLNAIVKYRFEEPLDVTSDYVPPYIECSIVGFDNSGGGRYGWTMAVGGSALRIGTDYVEVPPGPVYCSLLGIEPVMLGRSRWLYIVKLDAGPYEGGQTLRAAPSSQVCNADFNGDGVVNIEELGIMRTSFLTPNCDVSRCAADLNGDGVVNVVDLGRLRKVFGRKCS